MRNLWPGLFPACLRGAFVLLAAAAMLLVAACGVTSTAAANARPPTSTPLPTSCEQIRGFEHALPVTIPSIHRMLPTFVYAMEDQISEPGPGMVVFRLQVATPPLTAVCNPALFPAANGGSGLGYPSDVSPLDSIRVPLPPLTLASTSVWGYQPTRSGNSPYVRTPLCTQGSAATILRALKSQMPAYGWTASSSNGMQWQLANPGGNVLHLLIEPISSPAEWYIDEFYLNDGTPPVFPTPIPAGPDAVCSQVAGLEHAAPLSLPGLPFPADTVGVGTTIVSGAGKLTVVDYYACAPNFELTANPQAGSGGYPLEAVFEQANWSYSSSFPFDGVHQQACDYSMTGLYVNQLCRVQGTIRYAVIEKVAEPGKGLVTFHLLIATAP
jgi:hypothetical protein